MLCSVLVSCDRWIRTQFPLKAQKICTPRTAIYTIIVVAGIDVLFHVHILTPLFGQSLAGIPPSCGPNRAYPSYVFFFNEFWPTITIITVNILPATLMVIFVTATIINIHTRRNRVLPVQTSTGQPHEKRRNSFIHRQMFILMIVTLILFFMTTLPVALFRFAMATLDVQQPFSLSLLLAAIFGLITASNYALNFYLHSLTSKLFRKELCRVIPCCVVNQFNTSKKSVIEGTATQQYLYRTQRAPNTQSVAQ